jgi:phosphatidylserine/phosphatidylglycerophosphate/cardiolipin synthase-like enzyme
MADPIRRVEATHIDEVTRKATSTTQWFAERSHSTHSITHNNRLEVFICGEEGFRDIAKEIAQAVETIDLICWGFDPGMELVRNKGGTWPRGTTYGDLLIAAGKRGVRVRLLVWYHPVLATITKNMPGFGHGTLPWRIYHRSYEAAQLIHADRSLQWLRTEWRPNMVSDATRKPSGRIPENKIPLLAREEYCHSWYEAATHGLLKGITVVMRGVNDDNIKSSLEMEAHKPASMSTLEFERIGLIGAGTHHQKTILIDFAYENAKKAVGYVMGLNSVTAYWDTCEHLLENAKREQGAEELFLSTSTASECVQGGEGDRGFLSLMPYRDYACRIEGMALISVYNNFVSAWDYANKDLTKSASNECIRTNWTDGCKTVPAELLRKAVPGNSTVQIVRTQPDENDKSIKDVYYLATDAACLASGYLYLENQYFQNEEWAERLMQKRKEVVAAWKCGSSKTGKKLEEMPVMHVFIVIPVPERKQMVPSTHDTLIVLGDPSGMTGQIDMIEDTNKRAAEVARRNREIYLDMSPRISKVAPTLPQVVQHANKLEKRDQIQLEETFALKVSVAMLQTSGYDKRRWRYREIYIHSKLMLVDDIFMTLGSANMNQRSMAVDSEINIATNDATIARNLRSRVWTQLCGPKASGGNGTKAEIKEAFRLWSIQMKDNRKQKNSGEPMSGFLLPLEDERSSTIRLS